MVARKSQVKVNDKEKVMLGNPKMSSENNSGKCFAKED